MEWPRETRIPFEVRSWIKAVVSGSSGARVTSLRVRFVRAVGP